MPVLASPTFALQPSINRQTTATNYIDSSNFNFLNQYLPDIYESEFERYGNRSISGFLRMVGAEMPCASDLIKWAEQGRLHVKYTGCTTPAILNADTAVFTITPATQYQTPANNPLLGGTGTNNVNGIRLGQTLLVQQENGSVVNHAVVTAVADGTVTVAFYEGAGIGVAGASNTFTLWVYGSEFAKGSLGMTQSVQSFDIFKDNNPIILKDKFTVTGSDMTQIGWVEVTTENGASGYLWYMKAEHETRLRFEDYLESSMLEAVPAETASGAIAVSPALKGTKGVFFEVAANGNVFSGGYPTSLVDFDAIVQRLDKQGAIEENALFVNRAASFAMDDFLAAQNSYGVGGTSYGLFNNSEQMALNLGFRGFRRGYDFYKTDWKYLNDPTMRGQGTATGTVGGAINGMLVPAGSTNVYDQVMGQNAKRPFLHVRYRETDAESRKFKTWATGSAGGAATSDLDAMEVHYLSERCVCTLGSNNFFLFRA
jgi:hypothetical protein